MSNGKVDVPGKLPHGEMGRERQSLESMCQFSFLRMPAPGEQSIGLF